MKTKRFATGLLLLALAILAGCAVKSGSTEVRIAPLGYWTWEYPTPYSHSVGVSNTPARAE